MRSLRLVLLGVGIVLFVMLGVHGRFAMREAPRAATREPADPVLEARLAVERRIADAPDYAPFFGRVAHDFPADYADIIGGFAQTIARGGEPAGVDSYVSQTVRALRQSRGAMAAKAEPATLARIFDMQAQVMTALAGVDQRLCVDFLYGGASEGFFAFSAAHRPMIAQMANAGLDAIENGLARRVDRPAPSEADFAALDAALTQRGLSRGEIEQLLDGKSPEPALPDAQVCHAGQVYLDVLRAMPPEARERIYGLAVELMAHS